MSTPHDAGAGTEQDASRGLAVPAQVDPGSAEAPQRRRDLPRCSDAARERCDPLGATAAWTHRWLLLEHPGPWAPDALAGSGLPEDRQQQLREAAAAAGGRVLLVRRPGGRRTPGVPASTAPAGAPDDAELSETAGARRWAVVDQPSGLVRWGWWDADAARPDAPPQAGAGLDRAAAALAEPVVRGRDGGTDAPVLLVCAHGRHDACCAVRGRPVAAALAARWPAATWECSHVGGDRFAPNLLVLPDGAYYGDLDPGSAEQVVADHLAGAVGTRHLRGVSSGPPVVQAAVLGVLGRFGPAPVRAARGGAPVPVGEDRWEVVVTGSTPLPARCVVTVARSRRAPARLTCRAPGEAVAAVHEAVDVRVEDVDDEARST
ncbi:sucrase ferredoxin [uncultured Pseudokineococcus sp.]|uniref:sucrase ferredoxin n=1 Tax=uncultured Pseudokineococcus sp. TaxID=1642928 RepID=UPI00262E02D0|nr:sucrase ferredoxin [uncultured Pseudokineococcus sp.]